MSKPRRFHRRGLSALVVATLVFAGCSAKRGAAPADLLLVTIDTLRGDRWGCLGDPKIRTPEIDRVARGGTLAFEGRAPAPLTLPSHVSMMTGLPPARHGVRDNGIFALGPDCGKTLAEALHARGWTTSAFVSAFPLYRRFGLDRGFDFYDELLGGAEDVGVGQVRERRASEVVDRVERWFRRKTPDPARPLFVWVHFYDPHADYRAPAPWPALSPGGPYDAEVAYVDHELGRLLEDLATARPERAWRFVVASDHGESLGEHGEATHGVLLHAATLRVPIVARSERFAPRLLARPVPLESVARTAAELIGAGAAVDSSSAPAVDRYAGPVQAETLYPAFNFGWRGLRAREDGEWKLVSGARDRLYHVSTDPGETRDVAAEHPDVVAALRKGIEDTWAEARAAQPASSRRATSPDEIAALRSLGYLGGAGADPERLEEAFDVGLDPEDRIALVTEINLGVTLLDSGKGGAAESVLARVVADDPGNRLALEFLGRAHMAQRSWREARDAFRRAIEAGPNPVNVYLDLARVDRELHDLDSAERALEQAMKADSRSVAARQAMSRLLVERGRPAEAVALLEEAVRILPRSAGARVSLAQAYEAAGRPQDAIDPWTRAAELDPDGPLGKLAQEALARSGHPWREKTP
ncbi:MAG: sulfatase-like hydrolase/transferase [bacterium]